MSAVEDLYRAFEGYLRLSFRLVALTGNDVNVGENFTMRFTVSNQGPDPSPVNNPVVVFDNVRVIVEGTEFATPVAGGQVNLAVPDAHLFPGESSSVDVVMRALRNMGGFADLFSAERVAQAWAVGDVNLTEYFRIWQTTGVTQEIQPT